MLHPDHVDDMARRAAQALLASGAVECGDEATLVRVLRKAIREELTVEARLREEARTLIAAHGRQVRAEGADSAELLEKIVNKLARDRGVVLR